MTSPISASEGDANANGSHCLRLNASAPIRMSGETWRPPVTLVKARWPIRAPPATSRHHPPAASGRRAILAGSLAVLGWPRIGFSQQPERVYRIGWLSSGSRRAEPYNAAFVQRLGELGFVEGRNL